MSFREKTAWISMSSMVLIYGFYFTSLFRSGTHAWKDHYAGLLGTIVVLVIVQVALNIMAAIFAPKDAQAPRDERDRLIELRSTRVAYSGLATAGALACFFRAFDPPIIFNTNALFFLLVTAEVLRSSCQIIQYRRGA